MSRNISVFILEVISSFGMYRVGGIRRSSILLEYSVWYLYFFEAESLWSLIYQRRESFWTKHLVGHCAAEAGNLTWSLLASCLFLIHSIQSDWFLVFSPCILSQLVLSFQVRLYLRFRLTISMQDTTRGSFLLLYLLCGLSLNEKKLWENLGERWDRLLKMIEKRNTVDDVKNQ